MMNHRFLSPTGILRFLYMMTWMAGIDLNTPVLRSFITIFCNFDVEITVPGGFIVWASGILQNPEEVLTEEYFKRYLEARTSDEVVRILTAGLWKRKIDSR